ncbi:MAG: 3-isopropylmalate dehydratase large subunit, partial [Clostridia bacterium]|nr:3-isopropylmalate dehydratase large subunit [Clostridia bacterium]
MKQTITEKILASAAGKKYVKPGEIIVIKVDGIIGHDITTAAFRSLERMGVDKVFDKDKIFFTVDHFLPSPTLDAAKQLKDLYYFIDKYQISNFFEPGKGGICHALFPEKGLIKPGMTVVGSDSHTCTYGALGAFSTGLGATEVAATMATGEIWLKVPETLKFVYSGIMNPCVTGKDLILYTIGQIGVDGALYKAMEFTGVAIENLDMDNRFTICNMAVEAGAKNGIINPDSVTLEYLRDKCDLEDIKLYSSDLEAKYEKIYHMDVTSIEPVVAMPHSPHNIAFAKELNSVKVHQVVIGSCTNGRLSDLSAAADILKGKRVAPGVRVLVVPATQEIYLQAIEKGYIQTFIEAGAIITPPTCGACF